MAHFYGWIQGNRGEATRMGSKDSGIDAWVQGWNSRISAGVEYDSRTGKDVGGVRFGTGPSNYNGGALAINFHNLDDVINALNSGDPKINALRQKIYDDISKLDEEAPKALARAERKRQREMKSAA